MSLRRTRVRPKRATPRRRTAPRWTAEQWSAATQVLLARDHGRCPVCGGLITDRAERHHRQRRAVGGDRYANLTLLHSRCHSWTTEHPQDARDRGLIVSAYDDPGLVPLTFHGGATWLLADDGTRHPA